MSPLVSCRGIRTSQNNSEHLRTAHNSEETHIHQYDAVLVVQFTLKWALFFWCTTFQFRNPEFDPNVQSNTSILHQILRHNINSWKNILISLTIKSTSSVSLLKSRTARGVAKLWKKKSFFFWINLIWLHNLNLWPQIFRMPPGTTTPFVLQSLPSPPPFWKQYDRCRPRHQLPF